MPVCFLSDSTSCWRHWIRHQIKKNGNKSPHFMPRRLTGKYVSAHIFLHPASTPEQWFLICCPWTLGGGCLGKDFWESTDQNIFNDIPIFVLKLERGSWPRKKKKVKNHYTECDQSIILLAGVLSLTPRGARHSFLQLGYLENLGGQCQS